MDCCQPLRRVSDLAPGADEVTCSEGNTTGHVIASVQSALRGPRPWHVRTLLVREPGDLQLDHLHVSQGLEAHSKLFFLKDQNILMAQCKHRQPSDEVEFSSQALTNVFYRVKRRAVILW